MISVDEIDAIAEGLSPSMQHVVLRCSDDMWSGMETTWPRVWPDVVAGCRYASFHRTCRALERRGIVVIDDKAMPTTVALTRTGIRVQATLRLQASR